jgi:predicted permease
LPPVKGQTDKGVEVVENFALSFRVILPLVILLGAGKVFRRLGWLGAGTIQQMNGITFKVLLPAMLFVNIYDSNLRSGFDQRLLLYGVLISTLCCLLAVAVALVSERDSGRRAALAQGIFRNNYIAYGTAIVTAVYAAGSQGIIFMLIACIVPLNNIYSVVAIRLLTSRKICLGSMVRSILTNPFVIVSAVGFAVLFTGISLPYVIQKPLEDLGNMATPISMVLLGAGLEFGEIKDYRKDIMIGTFCKLILLPALFLPVLIGMGIRGEALLALLVSVCTPASAGSHIVAREMGADGNLAGHLIVFGTVFSCVTIFFWIGILGQMGLLY